MPLRSLGNMYFGGRAFGDPTESFRAHAPPGILDQFEPERQAELGGNLQKQLRSWTPSRRGILNDFREGLLGDVEMRSSQQKAEEEARMREGVVQGLGVMHQQGLLSDGGYQAAVNLPLADQSKIVQEYFKGANVGATDTRFFGSSQIAQGTPAPFTLSPGQARFDGDNARQASMPTTEQMNAAAGLRPEEASTTALRTIHGKKLMYMGSPYFLSEEDAFSRAMGDFQVMQDDLGNLTGVNRAAPGVHATNISVEGRESGAPSAAVTPGTTQPSNLSFDPGLGLGVKGTAKQLWNDTVGQIPGFKVYKDEAEAAQKLRYLERDAIMAFSSSSRPPVIEQQRIANLLPQPRVWSQNPELARTQLSNAVDIMAQQYRDDTQYAQSTNVSRAEREEARQRARHMRNLLSRIVEPDHLATLTGDGGSGNPEDIENILRDLGL